MPQRLPACDPCRSSKLSCDHGRPVCTRCHEAQRDSLCFYRSRPFKRRKTQDDRNQYRQEAFQTDVPTSNSSAKLTKYPNPGYLGSSSHTTIFHHLQSGDERDQPPCNDREAASAQVDEEQILSGAKLLERFQTSIDVSSCRALIETWHGTGANLALAGSVTELCARTAEKILKTNNEESDQSFEISERLFANSRKPLPTNPLTSLDDFSTSFTGREARWETLGLFFTAVSRAANDVVNFAPVYNTRREQRQYEKLALQYSDSCLDVAISLDCMNDLQLILQYENFILNSFVHGDQSYHSWRRLGDVVSSLYAMGYHELVNDSAEALSSLADLRAAAFVRAYSADKNLSIFLGRPPRIDRQYCQSQLPSVQAANDNPFLRRRLHWSSEEPFSYFMESCWSVVCVVLKEQTLDVLKEKSWDDKMFRTNNIKAHAKAEWLHLPSRLRLDGPLKSYDRYPVELDFMLSNRLNYLHILFLTQSTLVRSMSEPDAELNGVAAEMLGLVVQAIVLKSRLAFSGTGVLWKVSYYGLPAAGIVCLSLLSKKISAETTIRVFRDLNLFVAEVENGALVHPEDPDFAVLNRATQTIKIILNRILSDSVVPAIRRSTGEKNPSSSTTLNEEEWAPWADQDLWDFETDFWLNLSEHPMLTGIEPDLQSFL